MALARISARHWRLSTRKFNAIHQDLALLRNTTGQAIGRMHDHEHRLQGVEHLLYEEKLVTQYLVMILGHVEPMVQKAMTAYRDLKTAGLNFLMGADSHPQNNCHL